MAAIGEMWRRLCSIVARRRLEDRLDEEIRFQISADHTADDIDEALGVLSRFVDRGR